MGNINRLSTNNTFQENLEVIKEYIEKLIRGKIDRVSEPVKKKVEETVKKEPSFFDKLKGFFGGNDDKQEKSEEDLFQEHVKHDGKYNTQDMEFGESLGEQKRFAEITPGFIGYFTSYKSSIFDRSTNGFTSESDRYTNINLNVDKSQKSYNYAGIFSKGIICIPLPEGSLPDIDSLHFTGKTTPTFKIDQNNCVYIESEEKQYISFKFYTSQNLQVSGPIKEDSESIVFSKLSNETRSFLDNINNLDINTKSLKIKDYITKTKKYSTRLQGTLRDKSNSKNYITNLDKSPVLECLSANILYVALAREVGIPARLVLGHMVQSLDKDGKSLLGGNNGHAWSEVWDVKNKKWKRIDATPTEKENGESSNQNLDQNGGGQNQNADSNMDQDGGQSGGSSNENQNGQGQSGQDNGNEGGQQGGQQDGNGGENGDKGKQSGGESGNQGGEQNGGQAGGGKSPSEALEELLQKAKDDNLTKQAEQLKKTIEKLENANSKEEIRDILDKSGLTDFARDLVGEAGNEEILRQEQESIKKLDDEKDVDEALNNSLLDDEFKDKLKDYAREIKKQIQEQKKKMKSEMEKMGFNEEELKLYKLYKELETELEPEVRKQIKALEKILPPTFRIEEDRENLHRLGTKIADAGKLVKFAVSGDERVFRKNKEVAEITEINMFETIVIDRSGSMGRFEDTSSPLRQALKAAIIRAKVLEHFKVNFSIIIFDTQMEEVMEFGEKFSDKRKNSIPSRLMRAVMKSGGTDIGQPLSYVLESMKKYARKNGGKSFGNISFLGDGEPTDGLSGNSLKTLINEIRKQNFGLTAYYINGSSQHMSGLQDYFGNEESGGTVVVGNVANLTDRLIGAYNENLRKIIKRYTNKD